MTLLVASVKTVAVIGVSVVLVLKVGALEHCHPVNLVHINGDWLGLGLLNAHQLLGIEDESVVASKLNGFQLAADEGAALGVMGVWEDTGLFAELGEHLLMTDLVFMGHLSGDGSADAKSGNGEEQFHNNFLCLVVVCFN